MTTPRVTRLQQRALRLIGSGRWVVNPDTGGAHNPAMPGRLDVAQRTLDSLLRRDLVTQDGTALTLTEAGQVATGLPPRDTTTMPAEVPVFLPLADMEPRRLYRIRSRNLAVGVWDPEVNGFLGIREKFGSRYVDTEYHHETGAPHGTARPIEALDAALPEHIEAREVLGSACRTCGGSVGFDQARAPGDRWTHYDTIDCDRVRPVAVSNTALFDWLLPFDDAERASRTTGPR